MSARTSDTPVDVAARLRRTAADRPHHIALRWSAGVRTYGELHQRVDAGTAALQTLGIGAGERVAFVLGTTPTFVEVAAAVLRAGGAMVPLLPGLAPDELRFAIEDSQAGVVIVGPERIHEVRGLADEGLLGDCSVISADVDPEEDGSWERRCADAGEPVRVDRSADDLAALVYTSGTTGRPRGAVLTRRNLAVNQDQSLAGRFGVGAEDVVLLVLPLAHIYALNVGIGASLTAGATMVLVPRFEPAATLDAVVSHGVTVVLGAPPMYLAWLESGLLETADLGRVRLAVSGAAALPVPVFERFRAATGITIEEGYGLTEASPSVASNALAAAARPGSVGLPLPDLEVRLVDDAGADVAAGDPGELWVRGPNVFAGYWQDPTATAEVLTPDGWLRTGDVATRDEDGFLYLVDRRRDLIIVNGFNVYPREVERVLLADPTVSQAAAIGVPHPLTGEEVVAFVVPRPGTEVDPDALLGRCRSQLARYKCPRRIEVRGELPVTATGKVRRRALRDEAPAGP